VRERSCIQARQARRIERDELRELFANFPAPWRPAPSSAIAAGRLATRRGPIAGTIAQPDVAPP
jgi:hypothetical protein